jgi:hypothetical protein
MPVTSQTSVPILAFSEAMQRPSRPLYSAKNSLHTRSLRDLRSSLPPKSSNSMKSRHRAVQVLPGSNCLHTTPQYQYTPGGGAVSLCPPIPACQPPLTLSRQVVQCVHCISLSLSHISSPSLPFSVATAVENSIRTATASYIYPTQDRQCEAFPHASSAPLRMKEGNKFEPPSTRLRRMHSDNILRQPPVNPRKSRRYCTDFGLSISERRFDTFIEQPTPDNSSVASTPLAIYTETDSDSSSVYEAAQFEFPQPPETVSPLFSSGETLLKEETKRQCIDAKLRKYLTSPGSSAIREYWDSAEDVDECIKEFKSGLDLDGEQLYDLESPCTRLQKELMPRKSEVNYAHMGISSPRGIDGPRYNLLHVQSVSSIVPAHTSSMIPGKSKCVVDLGTKLDRPSIESSDSLRRLEISLRKLDSLGPRTRSPVTMSEQPNSTTFAHPQKLITPSLASAGRRKPTHRTHLSVPLAGLGLSNTSVTSSSPRPLASPFYHRSTKSQPMFPAPHAQKTLPDAQNPTSFMDITPEQQVRDSSSGARREKIRKLLARASSGVISWGRNLANAKLQRSGSCD